MKSTNSRTKNCISRAKTGCKNIKNDIVVDKLNGLEWIVLGVILLFILVTLWYNDNTAIFLVYFWDNQTLFEGNGLLWLGNNHLAYGLVQQVLCRLWVLPINVIFSIHWFEIANIYTMIWFKLSMSIVFTLALSEMLKIAKLLGIREDRSKWMLILFSSSILVALPVFHIAQTDILCAYMMLLALRHAISKNKKLFLLFMAMAVSCKLMALVALIPVLLLMEKRILRIIADTFLVVLVYPLENIWYKVVEILDNTLILRVHAAEVETAAEEVAETSQSQVIVDFVNHFYNKALFFEFPAVRKGYVASLMVCLFVFLCIFCYVQKKESEVYGKLCVYAMAITWLIFFTCASPSPYWIVMLYPFLLLMIFLKPECIRINMLLNIGYTITMFLVYVVDTYWVYGGPSTLDYLLFNKLLPEGHDSSLEGPYAARYLNNLRIDKFMNIITAVCFAAAVGLVVINYYKQSVDEELSEKDEKILMHGLTIFQVGFVGLWYIFNVYAVTRW